MARSDGERTPGAGPQFPDCGGVFGRPLREGAALSEPSTRIRKVMTPSTPLPSPSEFSEPGELAAALADALRYAPLEGPAKSLTRDVRDWAESHDVTGTDEEILRAHNEAADTEPD